MKEVKSTKKYEIFKELKGNREVSPSRVKKIIDSINSVGYITSPIIVNENMEVIDGQGRLKALQFLKYAATRHIQFNYREIAEYYAHASKEMQELMEDSALVIIDFKDAIAKGYTLLMDRFGSIEEADLEMGEEYEE